MKKIAERNETLVKVLFVICMVLCILGYVSSPVALVGGFLFSYFFGHPFITLNSKAVNWLLKIAVVGLGFGMNLKETLAAGKDGFLLTVFSISITLILGYFLGRLLKMNRKSSHLISSGTAICGGSAIAAVSPVINASEKDISISLGVIFLLNSIALIVFPPLGHLFGLNQHQFGLWCAIAIHDTSSVVGAAYTFGEEALKVATTVKLARALWIIPLSLLSVFLFKGNGKSVQIPYDLFIDLAMYHLRGEDDYEEEIRQGLEQKLDAMLNRQLYSRYKTAPNEEEREQARQEYLDRRGVPQSYRWTTPPWEL